MEEEKRGRGRPKENLYAKYVEGHEDEIIDCCEKGADLRGLSELLGCGLTTVNKIKHDYPEFKELIRKGGEVADEKVISTLFRRAIGYDAEETCTEVKVSPDGSAQTTYVKKIKKHIPPDTTAAIFWLKNRRRDEWCDNQNVEVKSDVPINISIVKDDGCSSKT